MIGRAAVVGIGIAATLAGLAGLVGFERSAAAQSPPAAPLTIPVGDFQLTPTLEVRARGEYRRDPVDIGGLDPLGNATPRVRDAVAVMSRARVGLGAERGPVRAQVTLQDARAWGASAPSGLLGAPPALAAFGAYEAYAEARVVPSQWALATARQTFLRIGRQAVRWGDGMLLGVADWSPTGRSLDAARAQLVVGNWDFELLAAILDTPRPLGASAADVRGPFRAGTQLYGARAAWALDPLARLELAALARVARSGEGLASGSRFAAAQAVGETYTASLRASGERGAFEYGAEGAGQIGTSPTLLASSGNRLAFAARVHASLRLDYVALTPTVRLGGAYATGDAASSDYAQFDPLLPDVHTAHGAMDVFALSNLLEANGRVTIAPADEVRASIEYRYARLAHANGEWLNAYLVSVGRPDPSADAELGHELDAGLTWQPWIPLALHAGYSVLLLGDGARSVIAARQRGRLEADGTFTPASLAHFAFLQVTVRVP